MLTLKYPMPVSVSENSENPALQGAEQLTSGADCLFDCPLQGEPLLYQHHARELGWLMSEIRCRLKTVSGMVCHPHRVGRRNAVSVMLTDRTGQEINLLLMTTGKVVFPAELGAPRWMIEVTDSVDVVYLLLWLKDQLFIWYGCGALP
ncbi:hypothetical protein [Providencia rettgeri]|uniref:hypothetical protein n=1 Tax=Providencia rettgeri TaxID=587 RepID=UPI0024AA0464